MNLRYIKAEGRTLEILRSLFNEGYFPVATVKTAGKTLHFVRHPNGNKISLLQYKDSITLRKNGKIKKIELVSGGEVAPADKCTCQPAT